MVNNDLDLVCFYTEINSTQVNYIIRYVNLAELNSRIKINTFNTSHHLPQQGYQQTQLFLIPAFTSTSLSTG